LLLVQSPEQVPQQPQELQMVAEPHRLQEQQYLQL
jgi:hypothetical protein